MPTRIRFARISFVGPTPTSRGLPPRTGRRPGGGTRSSADFFSRTRHLAFSPVSCPSRAARPHVSGTARTPGPVSRTAGDLRSGSRRGRETRAEHAPDRRRTRARRAGRLSKCGAILTYDSSRRRVRLRTAGSIRGASARRRPWSAYKTRRRAVPGRAGRRKSCL